MIKKNIYIYITRFEKKIGTWREKSIDDQREESFTVDPEEDPITEKSKRTLSLRTLKRILSMKNL